MFLGYVFVCIISQWHAARWVPGVIGFVMGGERPARVPEISELKSRERNGAIDLPGEATAGAVRANDRLQVRTGPQRGCFGLYVVKRRVTESES